jgi:predicted dehydrogenase
MHAIGRDYIDVMNGSWRFKKWGLLDDFGPHVIDIVRFLCNSSLKDVRVIARDYTGNMGCLNHVQAILLFSNEACVDIDLSWVTGAFEFSFKILGTAGTLEIDVRNNHLREIHGYSTPIEELASLFRKTSKIARGVINKTYFEGPLVYHKLIIRRFIESILNQTDPPIPGEEGKAIIGIMDAIKAGVR